MGNHHGKLKKITDYIIYSNLLIAAGAGFFIWESYMLFGIRVDFLYVILGFAATLFTYNIDRLVVLNSLEKTNSERHNWVVSHFKIMVASSIVCFIFLIVSLFYLPWRSILFIAHLGFISLAYSVPVLAKGSKNLRSVKVLKIFLITYVWAASTVVMPAVGAGFKVFQRDVVLLFIERALFIFAITLPFDIRDYHSDIENKVVTIPGLIGIRATRLLAFFCLLVFFLVNLFHYSFHSGVLWAKLLSGLSTLGIVIYSHQERHEYYFTGLLDSTIIIQFILVFFLCGMSFF
jgi:4-hydroxybenzoate polyprenyltransferase